MRILRKQDGQIVSAMIRRDPVAQRICQTRPGAGKALRRRTPRYLTPAMLRSAVVGFLRRLGELKEYYVPGCFVSHHRR
jgi:hypothetical protein